MATDAADRAVGLALEDDQFASAATALACLQADILRALGAAEGSDASLDCIEATRSSGGYLEAWYGIRCAVPVVKHDRTRRITSITWVRVDVMLAFERRDHVHLIAARVGSRTLLRNQIVRVLPGVDAWRPQMPRYWYALALLRESSPPGQCGTCLSEPYDRCRGCPPEAKS